MKHFFYLIPFILILFNSCFFEGCKVVDLPSDERKLINKYKVNQKFVFKSNLENYDTLIILEHRESYTSCNKLEVSDYQFNITRLRLVSKRFKGPIYFLKTATEDVNSIHKSINFIDLGNQFERNELNDCIDTIQLKLFKDSITCYTLNTTNSVSDYNGIFRLFSWSDEYGFLKYETKQGEIFELIKICINGNCR